MLEEALNEVGGRFDPLLMGERKEVHVNLCLIKDQSKTTPLTISLRSPELTHIYHFNYIELSLDNIFFDNI